MKYETPSLALIGRASAVVLGNSTAEPDNVQQPQIPGLGFDIAAGLDD